MSKLAGLVPRPEWWTAIFTGLLAATTAGALWYAHQQISATHAEAQVQHLLEIDQRYSQEPMVTYRKLYARKRLAGGDPFPEIQEPLNFFEMVALLVNSGYLKDTDVWEAFGIDIFPLYADARETIEQDRKTEPTEYSNLVTLVDRLESIDIAQHGTEYKPSKDDLAEFWKDEAAIGVGTPSRKHRLSPSAK